MPVNHVIGLRSRRAAPHAADPRREHARAARDAVRERRKAGVASLPRAAAVLELLKPVTWFPPMWAFGCGVVSAGAGSGAGAPAWVILCGLILAGPLVCAMSQAANDWYDRHVDAVNEPDRPIPSGRIPGSWGFWIAVGWTLACLAMGLVLGPWGLGATLVACALAWAYSAPPFRLKAHGLIGPATTGLAYEGLPWITGAAIVGGATPAAEVWIVAGLYALGAHGIMTLNDFKAVEGDRRFGIRTLPVMLGPERAAPVACAVMALPQAVVVALLVAWGSPVAAAVVLGLLGIQLAMMPRLLADPVARAPWYNGVGVGPYVGGMMAVAIAIAPAGAA
ncbi:MAG: chlorophyll synthase ChlG [Pseudomonadota bacterium]